VLRAVTGAVELSSASGMTFVAVTVAVSCSTPGSVGRTTRAMVAVALAARCLIRQITVPPMVPGFVPVTRMQLPGVVDTEPNRVLAGSRSVTRTPDAA